jgi:hypothetical protein
MKLKNKIVPSVLCVPLFLSLTNVSADQQFQDDVVVTGSLCVGVDCVNGENFNFDTIRLKENNLRIRFTDTSASSSFPSVDWQLTANDSSNGGANYFRIENIDGNTSPLTILESARNNAIYVTGSGVGFNTTAPLMDLHVKGGNSPTLRLEQDGSSGFAAQTWDVAGNETNFFVRDVTNSSNIPFKIRPSAPNNSLYIDSDGDIGFETSTPDGLFDIAHPSNANNHAVLLDSTGNFGINIDNGFTPTGLLDVQTTGGVSRLTVESDGDVGVGTSEPLGRLQVVDSLTANGQTSSVVYTNTNAGSQAVLLELQNAGNTYLKMTDTSNSSSWFVGARDDGNFTLSHTSGGGRLLELDQSGNLITTGTINGVSTKIAKENVESLNLNSILERLSVLDVTQWNYIKDADDIKHIGPMAEDFHKAFALNGQDSTDRIAFSDSIGVALAAIKALIDKNKALEEKLENLEAKIDK